MGLISISTLSPSIIVSCFPAEEARELCCSATLAVISKLFYAIFFLIFAMVGGILGALTGAFVGAKTKTGCLHGATVGAVKGSHFSIKFFKISLQVCSSDDMYLFQPINPMDSRFNEIPWIISRGTKSPAPFAFRTVHGGKQFIACHIAIICSTYRAFKSG
ncbi:hypothetical protein COLO4_26093 [Corchorus olitorius]|uniref:Uncharacterized protein n=1 Tax=Corchorus olitorius TaxID=93759 RepID=A0A1R3HYP9_9ROSI|nr:hypothetical protein COLO4_26093 [Corchorus olitorius]